MDSLSKMHIHLVNVCARNNALNNHTDCMLIFFTTLISVMLNNQLVWLSV